VTKNFRLGKAMGGSPHPSAIPLDVDPPENGSFMVEAGVSAKTVLSGWLIRRDPPTSFGTGLFQAWTAAMSCF